MWLATLDDFGALRPSDFRAPGDVYVLASLAEARALLEAYAAGRSLGLERVDGSRDSGAVFPSSGRGGSGPVVTLWAVDSPNGAGEVGAVAARSAWEFLAGPHSSDPYPDRRLVLGPRGGVVVESC